MDTDTSDSALLQAWQRHRDAEAFHAIVGRHGRLVYNTCRHILRNDTDAADVSQECFLSLASTPPSIRYSLAGWLHRLATHRSLDHLKAAKRRRDREVRYAREAVVSGEDEQADLMAMVDEAIDALPDDLRLPLIEHFLRRKSHQEVADGLGIPRRTVTYRINSGVDRVREQLRKRGVSIPLSALIACLESVCADAAVVPAFLLTSLGKYAIAGAANVSNAPLLLAAPSLIKGIGIVAFIAVIGTFGWWAASASGWLMTPKSATESTSAPTTLASQSTGQINSNRELAVNELDSGTANSAIDRDLPLGDAVLSGRVFDQATKEGIPEVEVTLTLENEQRTTLTDNRGEFEFQSLPSVVKRLAVAHVEGYTAGETGRDNLKLDPLTDNAMEIGLLPGPFAALRGTVRDESGNPAVGAMVVAWSREQGAWSEQRHEVVANAEGEYVFEELAFSAALFLKASTTDRACVPSGPLRIGNEGLADQDLIVQPVAHIVGKVEDLEGNPVGEDLLVRANLVNPAQESVASDIGTAGSFELAGLAPGTYELFVEEKRSWSSGWPVPLDRFELSPGETKTDVLLLTRVPEHLASIEEAGGPQNSEEPQKLGTIEGVVRDSVTGARVSDYRVQVNEYDSGSESYYAPEFRTESGDFMIEAKEVQSTVLTVSAPGFGPEVVTLAPGQLTPPLTRVDITLTPGAIVHGQVVDSIGAPVTGTAVYVNLSPSELESRRDNKRDRVQTDADGRFTLDTLHEEATRIYVIHPSYAYAWTDVSPSRAKATETRIALTKGASIHGTVYRSGAPLTEHNVLAFNVAARELGYFPAMTDGKGHYQIEQLVPGRYEVYTTADVQGRDFGQSIFARRHVDVAEGEVGEADLRFLEGMATVEGTVTINGAEPTGSLRAEIILEGQEEESGRMPAECNGGRFQAESLPDGPAMIQIMAVDAQNVRYIRNVPVLLLPFVALVQDIDIQGSSLVVEASGIGRGQTLELSIYDDVIEIEDVGAPDRDPRVEAMSAIVAIEENGTKEIAALPPGTYTAYGELFEYAEGKKNVLDTRIEILEIRAEVENRLQIAF